MATDDEDGDEIEEVVVTYSKLSVGEVKSKIENNFFKLIEKDKGKRSKAWDSFFEVADDAGKSVGKYEIYLAIGNSASSKLRHSLVFGHRHAIVSLEGLGQCRTSTLQTGRIASNGIDKSRCRQ